MGGSVTATAVLLKGDDCISPFLSFFVIPAKAGIHRLAGFLAVAIPLMQFSLLKEVGVAAGYARPDAPAP